MSRKKAGGIVASSFVAGLLFTAAIVTPTAWEPVPEPFFGLDAPAAPRSASVDPDPEADVAPGIAVDANPRPVPASPCAVPAPVEPADPQVVVPPRRSA
ncbi:MAG: hypothetical protein EBZ59_08300, partial [Planctomycetia bacterium]|nr:hypothetical protein [Planctomycetia bacterium]